ncbi:MAG: transcription antitermination factor NusB [Defluviitaleaceae bacterium]|nr:transcription antitermination factor NusB [Defluviitaleaceae bacterium]
MKHRTARIHILNLVFQLPFRKDLDNSLLDETITNYLAQITDYSQYLLDLPDISKSYDKADLTSTPSKKDCLFIQEKVIGTFNKLPQIDTEINNWLTNWEIDRLAKIDLALLRTAVYELKFSAATTSKSVIINEAVDLAKIYGTPNSQAFINGILGKLAQSSE